ncbi:MAG: hypothetical protein AAGA08_19645 [Pseudomonadota bacterium]
MKFFLRAFPKARLLEFVAWVLMKQRLRKNKADPKLMQQLNRIVRAKGAVAAGEFTSALVKILKGNTRPMRWILTNHCDSMEFVETLPGGRLALLDLVREDIEKTGDSELCKHVIGACDLPPDDALVTEFVELRLNALIERHLNTYQARKRDFDRGAAPSVLIDFKKVIEQAGHRFFLSSGTLLGVVRENGFIATDYDIDVGVFSNEINHEDCAKLFIKSPFEVLSTDQYTVCLRHRESRIDFDIFMYHEAEGMLFHGSEIHKWWTRKFELKDWDFNGELFKVPQDEEKILEEIYGNWQKPVLFFDLSYDCPCRSYNLTLESILYIFTRAEKAFRLGWRYYSDKAAEGLYDFFSLDCRRFIPHPVNAHTIPFEPNALLADGKDVLVVSIDDATALDASSVRQLEDCFIRTEGNAGDFYCVVNVRKSRHGNEASQMAALVRRLTFVDAAFVSSDFSEEKSLLEIYGNPSSGPCNHCALTKFRFKELAEPIVGENPGTLQVFGT